jgi:hypothetical protein
MKGRPTWIFFAMLVVLFSLLISMIFCKIDTFDPDYEHTLSLLAQFKNETMTMKTWLDHYINQGVDKFYLIDNASDDNPLEILQPYIDSGIVKYFYKPEKHVQTENYRKIIESEGLKDKTKWLIICDLDEFYYGVGQRLKDTMDSYSEYDIIYSNWRMFGTDGNIKHPSNIIKSIVWRTPEISQPTKYIVKPSKIINLEDVEVHRVNNIDNIKYENDNIRLNHYPLQSLEFYQKVKMTRGDVASQGYENIRDMDYFNKYNDNMTFKDDVLANLQYK